MRLKSVKLLELFLNASATARVAPVGAQLHKWKSDSISPKIGEEWRIITGSLDYWRESFCEDFARRGMETL